MENEIIRHDYFPIFSVSLADAAMKAGFVLKQVRPNRKKKYPNAKTVFFFDNTPEFYEFVNDYLEANRSSEAEAGKGNSDG